ncbi:general secretion pathway protein GspN [Luteimonas sp. BDR2-5]|uniref:general secretion pathway protein GspN n=1 Tax=Proluteimonas luteida TaxID=2878685 RepID=UPI001E2B04B3|nr:general secretion pathway protein GspN [Luteimonas sp. BDR2-5]MCD9027405.1 general secretion pathway protein GspN [Luteimonas sp. BDR2-5]
MRIDSANARTWLLAAVAGWALLVWGLSLAGLGARIERLDAEAEPLPAVNWAGPGEDAAAPPLSTFADIGNRPLFTSDRRPHPFFIDPQDEGDGGDNGFDYVLTSVLTSPGFSMAILQPRDGGESVRLKIGEAPPGAGSWVLGSVDARSVVFNGPEGPTTLELRVFDGTGGEPPTPMTAPPPAGDAVQATAPARRTTARAAAPVAEAPGNAATRPVPPPANARAQAPAPQQAPIDGNGGVVAETAESSGPSQAQVEAIRKRIEERRARLRQQQSQP